MNGRIDLKKAADTLKGARRVLLCTHVQPDGDAIGSLLAANALLTAMGKDTMMICESPVPENLRILQGWEEIRTPEAAEQATFDLACSLDASDLMRIGLAGGPGMPPPYVPTGVAVGADGSVYFSADKNNAVYRVRPQR